MLNNNYTSLVQKELQKEIDRTREDMQQILASVPIEDHKPFSQLFWGQQYPYYLYKDSTLWVWSDYRYTLDHQKIASVPSAIQTLETPQGKFIVLQEQKEAGGNFYELIALIKLYSLINSSETDPPLRYNPQIFPIAPDSLTLQALQRAAAVSVFEEKELFYVFPPNDSLYNSRFIPTQTLLLVALALFLLGIHLVLVMRQPQNRYQFGKSFIILLVYILIVRGLMIRFLFPFVVLEDRVFNPQYFDGSILAPSVGDLLLNYLCMIVLLVFVNSIYYRTETYRRLIRNEGPFQIMVSVLILIVSFMIFYIYYHELTGITQKSFLVDITQSIAFGPNKIVALLVFVCLSSIYFLVMHLVASLFIRLNPGRMAGVVILLLSTLFAMVFMWVVSIRFEWIFLLHIAYIFILYLSRLPRSFYGFRYPTTIYYFLGALVCAILTTYIVEIQETRLDVSARKDFARQLISHNDPFIEFLLNGNNELIVKDTIIQNLFSENTPLAQEIIEQRIKTIFLSQHLDKYEVEVSTFGKDGIPLDNSIPVPKLENLLNQYSRQEYATVYPTVFLITNPGEQAYNKYISYVTILKDNVIVGYLMLDLRQKNQKPTLRYDGLMLDKKQAYVSGSQDYSFAIFDADELVSSYGSFNYEHIFQRKTLKDSLLYDTGLTLNGFRHVGLNATGGKQVVVSSPSWGWKGILANFSLLYLVLVLVVALTIFGHTLHYKLSEMRVTYSTKIQVMLNAAFILPLLLVLFLILKIIGDHYRQNQQESQLDNTRNISLNVGTHLTSFEQGKMSRAYFEEQIKTIAHDADLDINLYDTTGRLLLSSTPLLYETGLVSELINPLAQKQIVEVGENQALLEESLSGESYNTAYMGIKSNEKKLLGVMSIPYFDSQPTLNRQIIDIVASVLIVFTAMLIVFLFVSYLAANLLIDPLRVLTRKISNTTLDQPNEPLPWTSNDEFGILIKKYNQMLVNLEMNKQMLSSSEKQSAWREMARQVVHEIKNPLTPMKLTLQQLQRTIRRDDPNALEKVGRAMESIIEQIDNIGYIAQSFSDIARMPLPQIELFEITELVNNTYESFKKEVTNGHIQYQKEIQGEPLYVNGDRQMFSDSVVDLLRNAQQSIPIDRPGEVSLKLFSHNENVMIEIQDNGLGIPHNIRSRVFLPNFATREDGTGLNLAMAKRIIEYAGGSIWFETDETKGTTFYILVPLSKPKT